MAPDMTHRVHHATDEEKLASTTIMGQTADLQEDKVDTQCSKGLVTTQPSSHVAFTNGICSMTLLWSVRTGLNDLDSRHRNEARCWDFS